MSSSWIIDNKLGFLQRFSLNVLKCGPIPKHLAFIMDGNRRFATKTHVSKVDGHSKGFDKLAECLLWCRDLGIKEVTVYAFSIENFNRTPEEIKALMDLATEKFAKLLTEEERLMEEGICVRVVGDLTLLSEDLRKLVSKAMILTRFNTKSILNVAFAYTARNDMSHAVKIVQEGLKKGSLLKEDVSEELLSKCLYTSKSPDPELLVRTSGEVRLSDFLLWQLSNTFICFREVLWPEFSFWHFAACIFQFQREYSGLEEYKKVQKSCKADNLRVNKFLDELQERQWLQLECYAS